MFIHFHIIYGFPGGASGKEPASNAGDIRDVSSIPGLGRSPGGGHGNPLQCSCLENPRDRGAWWAAISGVTQSQTQLKRLQQQQQQQQQQSSSWETLGWMKHKLESRLRGEISITQICRWYHPYSRKWRTKEPLDESERGEWKSWLKAQRLENKYHGIQSHHFMANRWGNSGNNSRLYFGELQNHCRWWLQPWN